MIGARGAGLLQSFTISVTSAAAKMRLQATDGPYMAGLIGCDGGVDGGGVVVVVVEVEDDGNVQR